MRVPDVFANTVCFLAVEKHEQGVVRHIFGGTAFFVGVPASAVKDYTHLYLVTAKHCVTEAGRYPGVLRARLNVGGGSELVEATDWVYHEDEAVDLAITAFDYEGDMEHSYIPADALASDKMIQEEDIGRGDEIIVLGLFTYAHGLKRNQPVLRTGVISSVPDELLEDQRTGLPYRGILLEMRSFGGLSGSPVLCVLEHGTWRNTPKRDLLSMPFGHKPLLVGIVRGHWNFQSRDVVVDFGAEDATSLINTGVAIATPAEQLREMLDYDVLRKHRRKQEERWLSEGAEPA